MEPKLEVGFQRSGGDRGVVVGGRKTAEIASAPGGDRAPVWDTPLPPEDFDVGDELYLKVLDKRNWPKKDVIIGSANMPLTHDMVTRQSCELQVQIYKVGTKSGIDPEHTGNISVGLQFASADGMLTTSGKAQVNATSSSSAPPPPPPPPRQPRTPPAADSSPLLETASGLEGSRSSAAIVFSGDPISPAGGGAPDQAAANRLQLVALHYWERGVRNRTEPILCTTGLKRWLYYKCCCCARSDAYQAPSRKDLKQVKSDPALPADSG